MLFDTPKINPQPGVHPAKLVASFQTDAFEANPPSWTARITIKTMKNPVRHQ